MPREQVRHSSGVYLWGCFQKRLTYESVGWVKTSLPRAVGIIQSTEGLTSTKRWRECKFPPFTWAGTSVFFCVGHSYLLRLLDPDWDLYHQLPWFSCFQTRAQLYHWLSCVSDGRQWEFWPSYLCESILIINRVCMFFVVVVVHLFSDVFDWSRMGVLKAFSLFRGPVMFLWLERAGYG